MRSSTTTVKAYIAMNSTDGECANILGAVPGCLLGPCDFVPLTETHEHAITAALRSNILEAYKAANEHITWSILEIKWTTISTLHMVTSGLMTRQLHPEYPGWRICGGITTSECAGWSVTEVTKEPLGMDMWAELFLDKLQRSYGRCSSIDNKCKDREGTLYKGKCATKEPQRAYYANCWNSYLRQHATASLFANAIGQEMLVTLMNNTMDAVETQSEFTVDHETTK
jgi:hypothetical protein